MAELSREAQGDVRVGCARRDVIRLRSFSCDRVYLFFLVAARGELCVTESTRSACQRDAFVSIASR